MIQIGRLTHQNVKSVDNGKQLIDFFDPNRQQENTLKSIAYNDALACTQFVKNTKY